MAIPELQSLRRWHVSILGLIAFTLVTATSVCAQNNPVPVINQPLIPASVKPGSGGFTLKVKGTGFAAGAILKWNGSSRVTIVDSASRLRAKITASDVANAGTAWITVVNPAPVGGTSKVAYLPIREPFSTVALARRDHKLPGIGGLVAGDFNNDGKLDILAGPGAVYCYLGNGDGTFQPARVSGSYADAVVIVVGDFNNDGNLDLAVSEDWGDGNIDILLGNGDGTFQALPPFLGPGSSSALAVADLNGDGKLDLYAWGQGEVGYAAFRIYLGNGDGTFQQLGNDYNGARFFPAFGDFNRNGILDIVVPEGGVGSAVLAYIGNGDGTLQASSDFDTRNSMLSVTAADVNGDGLLDLLTDGVSVLLGKADGTFQFAWDLVMPERSLYIQTADFNGDGKTDMALNTSNSFASEVPLTISILLGNGDATLQKPLNFESGMFDDRFGKGNDEFAFGDFNNDGLLDLATINTNIVSGAAEFSVFLQTTARIKPTSIDFGKQQIGQKSSAHAVNFKNIGLSPLAINGIRVKGADAGDFSQTNNCGSSLPPGAHCTIKVFFKPQQTGVKTAVLKIAYDDVGSPQSVSLVGTAVDLQVSLTPSKLTFPLQLVHTQSSPQTATLTNIGTEVVTINSISTSGPFTQTNNCGTSLNPGASCQIQVTFEPTNPGDASGTLKVSDNAADSPQKVALFGTGTIVKLSPISINFGDQPVGTTSPEVPVTLSNKGDVTLNISAIEIVGTNASDFAQTNNCGNSVPPGGSCKIKVTFTPTAQGPRSASLSISDDGGGSPQTVALAGNGT